MTFLINLFNRLRFGKCTHEGFFAFGDNEVRCLNCNYVERLR
jgi:hypothetical protein